MWLCTVSTEVGDADFLAPNDLSGTMAIPGLDPAPVSCVLLDEPFWQVNKSGLAQAALRVLLQLLLKRLPPP